MNGVSTVYGRFQDSLEAHGENVSWIGRWSAESGRTSDTPHAVSPNMSKKWQPCSARWGYFLVVNIPLLCALIASMS
eukprot:4794963-Amphidinium_carterae.3